MKEPCPECRKEGRDRSGDNLITHPTKGYKKCFSCGYFEPLGKGGAVKEMSKLSIGEVTSFPIGGDPARKVAGAVLGLYEVRHSANEVTGKPDTVYYPYFEDGKLTCYKPRKLPKDFRPLVGGSPKEFFGQKVAGKSKRLLITEGEEDCLAAKTMLTVPIKRDCDVVSLPNGSNLDDAVRAQVDFLSQYKEIFLCLDRDAAGKKAQVEIADWLCTMTKVKIVELEAVYGKDASDFLVHGQEAQFLEAMKEARVHEPEGIVNGIDISLDDLLTPVEKGYDIPFEGLQEKLGGLRKGEIVTICAGSGIGKSTLVREITKSLIDQGLSCANVALEDQMNVTAQALVALDMDIPLAKFRFTPPSKALTQPHYDRMVANGRTYFFKHFGGLTADSLMDNLYFYAKRKAVDFIILDHLSMVISATNTNNERKDIDTLMTNLAKMVVETGVGLIQIVHLKRTGGDKSFAKGGEVELTDLRGSAALEQLSWAVVGMERDQQGDSRDFSRLRVLKNRTMGFTGIADHVKFDTLTGRMSTVVEVPDLDSEELMSEDSEKDEDPPLTELEQLMKEM